MLELTPLATGKLTDYLQQNNMTSAIRVFKANGGCSGPVLSLGLDEEKPEDKIFSKEALTLVIDSTLLEQCGSITIDFIDAGERSGFSINPAIPLPNTGGCSSGACGSGSCTA